MDSKNDSSDIRNDSIRLERIYAIPVYLVCLLEGTGRIQHFRSSMLADRIGIKRKRILQ